MLCCSVYFSYFRWQVWRSHNWSCFKPETFSLKCTCSLLTLVPNRPLLSVTPGVYEATQILPADQDGDLALSHFHWKTTASGYHRCQQGAWVGGGGWPWCCWQAEETCFAFIFCLALWPLATRRRKHSVCTHLDSGSPHHPDDCGPNSGWGDPWVLNWRIKGYSFC